MVRPSMGESKAGGLCGILTGVFFVLTFGVAYNLPFATSQADQTLAGFSGMQTAFEIGGVLIVLAVVFAIPFFGALRTAFGGDRDLWVRSATVFSIVGILVTAILFIVEVVALAILKDAYAQGGASRAAAVVVAQVVIGFLGVIGGGIFLLAIGMGVYGFAMVRTSRFPHWLGYVGIVGGIFLLLGYVPVPSLFILFYGAFLLLIVWIFATGALLWRPASVRPTA